MAGSSALRVAVRCSSLFALVLLVAVTLSSASGSTAHVAAPTVLSSVAKHRYHNGTFGQAAQQFCQSTSTYTPSRRIRTKIVRSTDGWNNTIHSRYRKFIKCTAYQMTKTVWCTTKKVDGYSKMCITPRPKAGGKSPCRQPKLDVRGVYHPKTGILKITCVNEY